MMRSRGGAASSRAPLTDAQRRQKPPVSHPMVMVHPISGRKSLYADPGYTVRIDGMSEAESEELLQFLSQHQLQSRFQYAHRWHEVTCWSGTTSGRCTTPKRTTVQTSRG